MHTKREALRADRLACTALLLVGGGVTALMVTTGLEVDGSAVAPALVVAGIVGLVRLRPTAGGRRTRARRAAVSA